MPQPDKCKQAQRVLTADEIRKKWECEERGIPWVPPWQEVPRVLTQEPLKTLDIKGMSVDPAKRAVTALDMKRRLDDLLARHGVEPAEELIRMAVERSPGGEFILSPDQRIQVWTKLLEYRMPKLKSLEVSGTVDHELTVVVRKFDAGDTVIERKIAGSIPAEVVRKEIA